MSIYLSLFLNFLKIGAFTFGGAYGAIPLIREAVLTNGWLSEEQFSYFLAVSESTPGPIMVNMATYVGFSQGGVLGSALCTLGTVLPAYIVMILITSVLRRVIHHPRVRAVLGAVVPAVTGIIFSTGAYMTYEAIFSLSEEHSTAFDLSALLIGVILVAAMIGFKKWKKKPLSPILLIVVAAGLGMLFYGI
ncbi:MAG: chromate transporter [Clostridia bacterium]|nr:chromate transporter [Clostridia bacterium]